MVRESQSERRRERVRREIPMLETCPLPLSESLLRQVFQVLEYFREEAERTCTKSKEKATDGSIYAGVLWCHASK